MDLYPYQEAVADLLLAGKNIILQAPTGAGKTRAALYPFLTSLNDLDEHYGRMPLRCVYSVPMRILAKQFFREYDEIIERYNLRFKLNITRAIQTGEQQESRELADNLIFATIDQALSAYLMTPYSLSPGRGNLNAGALLSSYLVFDEFHLFDPHSTLPTTLHMLRRFKGITPFMLMTATFSGEMLHGLAELLDAVVFPRDADEQAQLLALPSQNKIRRCHTADTPLNAEIVLDRHRSAPRRRSLVICNTVDRARYIYQQLRARIADSRQEMRVLLLHSRFLPEDRSRHEDDIRAAFGKGSRAEDYIVVATQAVEVGVDMSSDVLHTELAPANAIIQRAGRCARYEGEEGDVYIYAAAEFPDDEAAEINLLEKTAPYTGQGDEICRTWEAFQDRSGQALDFKGEQAIISHAHGPADRKILDDLHTNSYQHNRAITYLMNGGSRAEARDFIREVLQQRVTIHANPDAVVERIHELPSFGLHPGTLQKYIKQWLDAPREEGEWAVKIVLEQDTPQAEDAAQANQDRYWIRAISDATEAKFAPLVIVHPRHASYDRETGFLPDTPGDWEAPLPPEEDHKKGRPRGSYRLETYEAHIAEVYAAFEEQWPEAAWAARQLERRAGWPGGSVLKAARLAVLLHDVGKLNTSWQKWARSYQQRLAEALDDEALAPRPGEAYAHTHFDRADETHRSIQTNTRPPRPWHAVESALAVWDTLMLNLDKNEPLARAAYSAIARHHAPHSSEHRQIRLVKNARRHIEQTAKGRLDDLDLTYLEELESCAIEADEDGAIFIAQADQVTEYLTYCLLVRALRRADNLGTQRGSNRRLDG